MPPKKSIFRQPGAKHFQLVHRSQRDPLIHDTDASQHVLKPFERENAKKVRLQNSEIDKPNQLAQGNSRADLESLLPASVLEYDKKRNIGEAALYGIYYDDTEYDYMQHLRTVGMQDDGVESIMIEAPIMKNNRGKGIIKDDLLIPQEALPSTSELPRNYESQQAIPESIAGFRPDMDPHLRQVLEALEDDAFVDDNLTDDFFSELVDGGERGSEEIQLDFDENNIEGSKDHEDEHDGPSSGLSWEGRFAQFKRVQARKEIDSTSDDEFASEGGDTIGELPTISVLGGKGKKRRKGSSDASGYTMSSLSMHRNKALQTLDEQFDWIMQKEYHEEAMEQVASDEDTNEVPELITSRQDFDSMVNEFLQNYEILGKKMKPKLEGDTPIDKLDTIRNALRHVRINDDAGDEIHDLIPLEDMSKEDRWDCETILTTHSNMENHPRIIRVHNSKRVPKITLDSRTGFPLVNGSLRNTTRCIAIIENFDGSEPGMASHKHITVSRPRNETKEDKKARKMAARSEKQNRRIEKQEMKEQFAAELKVQKRVLANKTQCVKRL